ncbi:MAG: hypothetical protein K2K51_00330 [Bacteroidales bacterium]|nr:hypothetical protein [Bacteroidales bacterium]
MKKPLRFRIMPVLAIGLLALCTSCKQDKPLQLQGIWQEESYWTPNDSIAADTLIHTYTLRQITFGCDSKFALEQTTYHQSIADDPALSTDAFTEYISGTYLPRGKNITLKGDYFTDNTYSAKADSTNTPYSYGPYLLETTYQLDSKRLILGATSDSNATQHTFAQTQAFECY